MGNPGLYTLSFLHHLHMAANNAAISPLGHVISFFSFSVLVQEYFLTHILGRPECRKPENKRTEIICIIA